MNTITRFNVPFLLLCLLAVGFAPRAEAIDVRLELSPGLLIPMGPFLDGTATNEAQADLSSLGGTGITSITSLSDVDHKVGGGIALALLLDDFEFRYEFAVMPFSKLRVTHLGLITGQVSFYLPTEDLGDGTVQAIIGRSTELDLSPLDSAFIHNVGFGYRFTPFPEWVVHPFVPFGLGFSAAQLRNDLPTLLGFYVQLGLGLQWDATEHFRIGLDFRYTFHAYKNPDTSISAVTQGAAKSLTTNSGAFDAVVEDLHTLNIRTNVSWKF